jgi:hypothetical protein
MTGLSDTHIGDWLPNMIRSRKSFLESSKQVLASLILSSPLLSVAEEGAPSQVGR